MTFALNGPLEDFDRMYVYSARVDQLEVRQ
jgi:hypothetical protein